MTRQRHHRRAAVAIQLRIGKARMSLVVDVDAAKVAGLSAQELHDAVYPAVSKALEDLTFEVVEITTGDRQP